MENNIKNTITLLSAGLLLGCLAQNSLAAPFTNGDFETGNFSSWTGYVDNYVTPATVDPSASNYFNLAHTNNPTFSWIAQISLDDMYFNNTLYQDFTMDTLAPGETMDITYWISWDPSASDVDGASVVLEDGGGQTALDLLAGVSTNDLLQGVWVTQDITSFAQTYGGQDVSLNFSLFDNDFVTDDTLSLDNISFTRHAPNPVPEPASVALFATGLAGLVGVGRKARKKEA